MRCLNRCNLSDHDLLHEINKRKQETKRKQDDRSTKLGFASSDVYIEEIGDLSERLNEGLARALACTTDKKYC